MSSIVVPLKKHKKFYVQIIAEREDDINCYQQNITTEVVIPDGRPMIELLANTIFQCLRRWAIYDADIEESVIKIARYTRLCDETVIGFIDIENRRTYAPREVVCGTHIIDVQGW